MTHRPAGQGDNDKAVPKKRGEKGFLPGVAPARDIKGSLAAGHDDIADQPHHPIAQANSVEAKCAAAVLFVDDEAMVARMGKRTLTQLGYDVTTATNSREALATFCADPERFDIVITDQTMPELTGLGLAQELLAIRPDLPIVLATGYSEQVDEQTSKAAGIREYIKKPIEIRVLAEIIEEVLA